MLVSSFFASLFISLLVALAIVLTQRLHGHLTHDSHSGVQKLHAVPTPRIGGIALAGGMLAGGPFLPEEAKGLWAVTLLAATPAFAAGLIEDITKRVGVKARLLATILAGLIFVLLTGYRIDRVDLPLIDALLGWAPLAVVFTAVAIGGIANAVNLIDGVNGLASGTSIIIATGLALVAWSVGDTTLTAVCLLVAGALAGFFLLNFPLGKLFLGDAGAYATGFVLAVLSVALPQRNIEVTPLIGLLALSYPVIETMVSIHRRMRREGTNPGTPDRLHLHSLIYRSRARRLAEWLGAPHLRNALTGLLLLALPMISTAGMVLFHASTALVLASVFFMTLIYLAIYRRVALLRRIPVTGMGEARGVGA